MLTDCEYYSRCDWEIRRFELMTDVHNRTTGYRLFSLPTSILDQYPYLIDALANAYEQGYDQGRTDGQRSIQDQMKLLLDL